MNNTLKIYNTLTKEWLEVKGVKYYSPTGRMSIYPMDVTNLTAHVNNEYQNLQTSYEVFPDSNEQYLTISIGLAKNDSLMLQIKTSSHDGIGDFIGKGSKAYLRINGETIHVPQDEDFLY